MVGLGPTHFLGEELHCCSIFPKNSTGNSIQMVSDGKHSRSPPASLSFKGLATKLTL